MPSAASLPVNTEGSDEPALEVTDVDQLYFDPENPRLPASVRTAAQAGKGDAPVYKWLLSDGSLIELMSSIGSLGFFAGEPLLVTRDSGRLIVVEGNRRLAAVKLLSNPELAPSRPRSVAEVVDRAAHRPKRVVTIEFASRQDILDYLGYRHITGIKEWEPQAKARYLQQLWARTSGDNSERLRVLADKIGSKPYYVSRMLRALSLYQTVEDADFYEIDGLNGETFSFSLLTLAMSFNPLVEFVGLTDDDGEVLAAKPVGAAVEQLTRWMFESDDEGSTVVGDSRNLKVLAAVVAQPEALRALTSGVPLEDAAQLTEEPSTAVLRNLRVATRRLATAQQALGRLEVPGRDVESALEEIVNRAEDMLAAVARRARKRARSEDSDA